MPLSKEEIAQRKAQATGQPAPSGLAERTAGGNGIAIPDRLQSFIGEQLTQEMVVAAISQPSWRKALDEGGVEAVAAALYICKTERLQPHRGHVYIFKPDQTGPWQAMVTASGYTTIAGRKVDNTGRPLFLGIRFEDAEEKHRGADGEEESYVVVKASVHWQGGGFSQGEGRKPRYQTVGIWDGPKGNRRKVGEKQVWDKNAEGKAETMAARRALQLSPFADSLPLDEAPLVDETTLRRVEQDPPDALPAGETVEPGVGPVRPYPRKNSDGEPSVAENLNQKLAQEPEADEEAPRPAEAEDLATPPLEPEQPTLGDVADERAELVGQIKDMGARALGGERGLTFYLVDVTGSRETTTADQILEAAPIERLREWADEIARAATAQSRAQTGTE